jgi:hypothetical protein
MLILGVVVNPVAAMTDLSTLEATCVDAHRIYRAAREALAAAVGKPVEDEVVQALIASTLELGLDATLARAKPGDDEVTRAITDFWAASHALSGAVYARESAKLAANPQHERVYVDDGREFTLDVANKRLIYRDEPDVIQGVTITRERKTSGTVGALVLPEPARKRSGPRRKR